MVQTWAEFHFVNSNSFSIPVSFFTYYFLPSVDTPSTYLEYLFRVVYISSRIVVEEIFSELKN